MIFGGGGWGVLFLYFSWVFGIPMKGSPKPFGQNGHDICSHIATAAVQRIDTTIFTVLLLAKSYELNCSAPCMS